MDTERPDPALSDDAHAPAALLASSPDARHPASSDLEDTVDATAANTPLRPRLAGLSLLAGGVTLALPPFLGPPNGSDDTRARLTDLAADPTPTLTKSLVFQAAVLLLLPGVVAIVGRARGRGSAAVVSGAVVYGAGLVGVFSFMVMSGAEVSLATSGPIDDALVRASDAVASSPATVPAAVLALLLFHLIGLPWLTFGMVRARMLPLVAAVVATAGTISAFFGSGTRFESVGWVVLGGTLAYIGWTVARPPAPTSSHTFGGASTAPGQLIAPA